MVIQSGTNSLIALGSNLGCREDFILSAWAYLGQTPGIRTLRLSGLMETEPVGGPSGQGLYLNAVGLIRTQLSAYKLLAETSRIERELERRREIPWGPRTIDIDILLYGNTCLDTRLLTIPHPRMCFRRFVLEPAMEIVPEMLHPLSGKTIRQLFDAITVEPLLQHQ